MGWQRKTKTSTRIDQWQNASLYFIHHLLTTNFGIDKANELYMQMKNNPSAEVDTVNYKLRYKKEDEIND